MSRQLQVNAKLFEFFNPFLAQSQAMGALPSLYAATAPDVKGDTYYGPSGAFELRGTPKVVGRSRRAHNADTARRLWEVSTELTGVPFELAPAAKAA